jgi:glycogen synthase
MKVLLIGPYPPPHGGVESNLVAIRNFLLKRKVPCAVINVTRHRKTETDRVYYPTTSFDLLRLLIRLDYNIIHMHVGGNLSTRLLALGLVCCLMPRSKTVFTFHSGGYPSSPRGRSTQAFSFTGFVLRRFDKLIAVNSAIVDFFRKVGARDERICLICPHSFPGTSSSGNETGAEPIPESLATFLETHSPNLISVGGLETEYDIPLQIGVLGRLREEFADAGLLLIGSGSLEKELRDLVAAQPDADHMLLAGDVPHSATLQAIAQSDIMLRTTLYDGDAISVREALHLGIPVIATDNGMRPPGVRLIPTSDREALFDAIREVLSAERPTASSEAPADEANLEAIFHLYQELLGTSPSTGN